MKNECSVIIGKQYYARHCERKLRTLKK